MLLSLGYRQKVKKYVLYSAILVNGLVLHRYTLPTYCQVPPMQNSILILNCIIAQQGSILQRNSYILVEDGYISAAGPMNRSLPDWSGRVVDAQGSLVISGLINGHNHSPMTLFRGMADDLDLTDWLHNHIFPAEAAHVNQEMVYWCSKLAAAEMLLSGTTCAADGYFHADSIAEAFSDIGIRGVIAQGVVDFPAPGVPDPKDNLTVAKEFIEKWKDNSSLITPAVFAHSPYTCSPETLIKTKRLADLNNVRFFIHIAESKHEQAAILSPEGETPLQHLHNLGLLDETCVLIHGVWLNDEDIGLIKHSGAHVIVCPQSNFKLASGRGKALQLVTSGIEIGLGTDGCASNNSLDMFREMELLAKSQKVFHNDPTVFSAESVLRMATRNTNRSLGLSPGGELRTGQRGDLVLIDVNSPHLTPLYSQDLLAYGVKGSDVQTVVVGGEVVVHKRKLQRCSLSEILSRVQQMAQKLGALG